MLFSVNFANRLPGLAAILRGGPFGLLFFENKWTEQWLPEGPVPPQTLKRLKVKSKESNKTETLQI